MRYNNIKNMSNNEFKRLADRFIGEFLSRINSGKLEKMELINSDAVRLSTDNITDDEWNKIKVVMKSILTNSNSVEIKYLKWED